MAASRIRPLRPSIRLSPAHSRDNSRSTSPERNSASLYPKLDPLLSNLSPESTLHALTSTEAVPTSDEFSHDVLSRSISQVSPSERALGIRAAIAARNLNLWYREVQSWTWPTQNDAIAGKGFVPPSDLLLDENTPGSSSALPAGSEGVEYYGSLPAELVQKYERRAEEIRDEMENLNVEELKEHVLNAHIPSRSRPSSSTSTVSVPPPLSYVQLSDFTAVVTATILRALPFLSRLSSLLTTWDVRLVVLRQIPGLLREFKSTRSTLDASLHVLRASSQSNRTSDILSSSFVSDEHFKLETAVVAVGRRMDRCLDALEGRQDSLPDCWIDDLEKIEADFAAWVVEAERYKLRLEWMRENDKAKEVSPTNQGHSKHSQNQVAEISNALEPQPTEPARHNTAFMTPETEPFHEASPQMSSSEEQPSTALDINNSSEGIPGQVLASRTSSDSILHLCSNVDSLAGFRGAKSPKLNANLSKDQDTRALCTIDPQSDVVSEDLQTPTQAHYLQFQSFETPRQQSSGRVPLPTTQNEENIPPMEAVQLQIQLPIQEAAGESQALTEQNSNEDDFIQGSPDSDEAELKASSRTESPILGDNLSGKDSTTISDDELLQNWTPVEVEPGERATEQIDQLRVPGSLSPQPDCTVDAMEMTPTEAMNSTSQKPTVVSDSEKSASHIFHTEASVAATQSGGVDCDAHAALPSDLQHIRPTAPGIKLSDTAPTAKNVTKQPKASRKPLQSPIKLSRTRPVRLNLDKSPPNSHRRRPSSGSISSPLSQSSSFISSPDARGPNTGSSSDAQLPTPPGPVFSHPASIPFHSNYKLRENHLRRLDNPEVPKHISFHQNRSVSLPLERFINEKVDLGMGGDSTSDTSRLNSPRGASSITRGLQSPSMLTFQGSPYDPPALARGKSVSNLKAVTPIRRQVEHHARAFGTNTARRAAKHQEQPKSLRLRNRLTAHPSLESLGMKKHELAYVEEDESELINVGSRASSPNKQLRKSRDHLDEKINSILNTLPGRIHLVDSNHEAESSSSSSSLDRKVRGGFLSESPYGAHSRSITPAPSLTIIPATRRRYSHAHKMEDSYVKLYHLHHGGQTTPTKLFVRTVGEDSQRVMVRVGGGWADLGEYLREYVIHHGHGKVSETPRVEVQGLASRSSPGHSTPSNLHTSAPPHLTSGRATPSRPSSVLSARPPSSLAVRKTRRGSNASDAIPPRSATASALRSLASPPCSLPPGRRLSTSSSYSSIRDGNSPVNANASTHEARSTPLGLAGPKPRSRHVSMSPEGEAWVEDVLQQTRRSSSQQTLPFALNIPNATEDSDSQPRFQARTLPKVRSVGDIGSIGAHRRVILRGLGSHR